MYSNARINSVDKQINNYCDKVGLIKQQLLKKFNVKNIEDLPNWVAVLILMTQVSDIDFLDDFIHSNQYIQFEKEKEPLYYATYTNRNCRIPDELSEFFLKYGKICPLCGGLIVESTEYNKLFHADNNKDLIDNLYCCCNCDYTTDSLDNITISINQLEVKKFLTKEQLNKIRKYRFEYDTIIGDLCDNTSNWSVLVKILKNRDIVGTLYIAQDNSFGTGTTVELNMKEGA